MTITKWLIALGLIVLCAGCSDTGDVKTEGRQIELPDGRTVMCVVAIDSSAGSTGVSCDWVHVK